MVEMKLEEDRIFSFFNVIVIDMSCSEGVRLKFEFPLFDLLPMFTPFSTLSISFSDTFIYLLIIIIIIIIELF